jgi:pilus assembly protein CpaE
VSDGSRAARAIVVLGASGGCGASLLAGGLALAWQREQPGAWLVELDVGRGDLAEGWDLPGDRTLADLAPVVAELAPHHLRAASREHLTGITTLVAPGAPGGPSWDAAMAASVVAAVRDAAGSGRCVIDAGCGLPPLVQGAVAQADGIVVACSPRVAAARRARGILSGLAATGDDGRCALVVAHGPGRPEIGARSLGRSAGAPGVGELPWSQREANDLAAGRWPRGRRARLAAAVAAVARVLG